MTATISAKEYQRLVKKGTPKRPAYERPRPVIPLDGQPLTLGALELTAVPPSLNNAFINIKKGRTKSPPYRKWIALGLRDLKRQGGWHVAGVVEVDLTFRKGETGADLDNLIKPVLDLLVSAGRIADDRHVGRLIATFQEGSSTTPGVLIKIEKWP